MPLPSNFNAFLGAGVLGIVCAATVYLVEQYRNERRRHRMAQDLARLDSELAVLRKEFDQLLAQQLYKKDKFNKTKKLRRDKSRLSSTNTISDDCVSATDIDSDDLEFYDVSDNEEIIGADFDEVLKAIDDGLESCSIAILQDLIKKLQDYRKEMPYNPHLLWRIGKANYKLYEKTDDKDLQKHYLNAGIEACQTAVDLSPKLVEVHKWLAILIGSRSDFQPIKEKILDGHTFKQHVDIAIALDPNDAPLHHMLGRFCFEIAGLKWYERKIAGALYAQPPDCSYDDALGHFLKAEELSKNRQWKENKLCIGKCLLQMGRIDEGIKWLLDAEQIDNDIVNDDYNRKITEEIKGLLTKYNNSS